MSTRNSNIQQVAAAAPVGSNIGDTWFNPTTNRQYQLLPVNGTTVQWAEVPTGANGYGAVTATPNAYTALQSFIGSSNSLSVALINAAEKVNFVGFGASGTINYNVTSQSVLYHIGNAGSNWIVNFRGSEGASLNSMMAIGQSVTVVLMANMGATAYFNNGVRVDGTVYTPAWQGGTAPSSGTASGTDLYSYTIVKTNEFSFIVFASRTAYSTPVFVTNVPGIVNTGLYEFNSAVAFTPGGTTGRDGPSLASARSGLTGPGTDAWKNNAAFFNVTDGIQYWTVPRTATYTISAWGAQGGNAGGQRGGFGARIQGDFSLTEGEIIRILVGQQGSTGGHTQDGQPVSAGGGGTYVMRTPYNTTGAILVVAGGGGGAAQNSWNVTIGQDANTSNNGGQGGSGSGGGTGGGGGASSTGCGGAGFSGNGATGSGSSEPEMARAFTNGGRGGGNARSWGGAEIYGGFGGGGGGGGLAAGGGGGFSGGAAGQWSSTQQGGGGGSFNSAPSGAVNEAGNTGSANLAGAGQVVITPVATAPGGGGGGAALYSFVDATFTSGGVGGRLGPSLSQARTGLTGTGVDGWKGNTAFFDVASGIQSWIVPETATYRIEAAGAGAWNYRQGGYGARIRGTFALTQGETIRILVGQEPSPGGEGNQGGAAGGTFVTKTPHNNNASILVIAGGGGGGHNGGNQSNSHGNSTGTAGRSGTSSGGTPGSSGSGGGGQDAGGGGGFFTNGTSGGSGQPGFAYVNGGFGSQEGGTEDGGFGGGGSSGNSHGGGGGGYSGGAGTGGSPHHGGGGGSFSNGITTDNQLDQHRPGPGYVTITKI